MGTVEWVSIIIGLTVVTFFSLTAMIIMRRRERARAAEDEAAQTAVERIDAAADTALNEFNKTAKLALDEINEKYQAMVFLYSLLDEKKKEIENLANPRRTAASRKTATAPPEPRRPRAQSHNTNARYGRIWALYNDGAAVPEIAKQLNIGQGEVQLMLDLAKKKESLEML